MSGFVCDSCIYEEMKEAAEFETRVANHLVTKNEWLGFSAFTQLKHARLAVEEEMNNGYHRKTTEL